MNITRSVRLASAAALALALAGAAQAHGDLNWSVSIAAAPGLTLNVGNLPQFVAPPPVHVTQVPVMVVPAAPVYRIVQPAQAVYPVYSSTVYVRPAPVIRFPVPRVAYGRHGHRHWHH